MTIEVGQILDKYELLEKVGQGGMAVVYRGLDRSLRREVAVKVLHRHLADHQEARDRFQREAHAVAKLRHANILEIFDFSGGNGASSECYIVTEFIDGQTLKEFITEHPLKYPEIGALIATQVCRALDHAHRLGILHRDVKPENIMIRNDGVVKLTDFGIAQMVDLQRMTVTGQLLGSPAYMSPEHVEGKPLDFRTDVFSVGILLYQLVTGELPFTGRNAHEILKRIAECRYQPAQQANPLVGNELGSIIAKAMAQEPDQRYPTIGEMLSALERYLEGCGLKDHQAEVARFFAAPASYEMALRPRLLDAMTRRGRELLAENRVAALEMFNRVLTLDPDHPEVLREIEALSRRRRTTRMVGLAGAVVGFGALAYLARGWLAGGGEQPIPADAAATIAPIYGEADAGVADAGARDAAPPIADAMPVLAPPDARRLVHQPGNHRPPTRRADASVPIAPVSARRFTLVVFPRNSEYRVGAGPWTAIAGNRVTFTASPADRAVDIRNTACCEDVRRPLGDVGGTIDVTLGWLPGEIKPTCTDSQARVQIDGEPTALDDVVTVPIGGSTTGQRSIEVVFYTADGKKFDKQQVRLRYRESKVVPCRF